MFTSSIHFKFSDLFSFSRKSPKAGKGKKKKKPFKDANKKINDCLYDLSVKVDEATNKNLCFTKISEVDEVSWKVIDCLVKDEVKQFKVPIYALLTCIKKHFI